MRKFTVTIGSLTEANILVTFRGIECKDKETAGIVACGLMAMPELWAVSSVVQTLSSTSAFRG